MAGSGSQSWIIAALALLIPAACTAPSGAEKAAASQEKGCYTRVLIQFSMPPDGNPDEVLVADLARRAGANLEFVRAVGAGIYLFALTSEDLESTCEDALERLRKDTRVRSAESDVGRKHH